MFLQRIAELPQGLLLLPVEAPGGLDVYGNELVAPSPAVDHGDALALEAEGGAGLGTLGQGVGHLAVNGGDLQLPAQHRLGEGDGRVAVDVGPVPPEKLVGLDGNDDLQVPGRSAVAPGVALSPEGNDLPVVDARRDGDLHGLPLPGLSGAAAALAGGGDDLPLAAALGAGPGGGEDPHGGLAALLYGAGAAAARTGLRTGARGRAGALAGLALLHPLQGHLLLAPESRLLKGDGQSHAQAVPPLGAGPGPGPAAEASPEEAAEDVPQVPEVKAPVKPAAVAAVLSGVAGVHSGETELVVPGALAGVAEDLVGLVDLLEAPLGALVAGVHVRVVLLGQLPVSLFDFRVRGGLLNAQDLVVVSLVFGHSLSHPISRKTLQTGRGTHPRPI